MYQVLKHLQPQYKLKKRKEKKLNKLLPQSQYNTLHCCVHNLILLRPHTHSCFWYLWSEKIIVQRSELWVILCGLEYTKKMITYFSLQRKRARRVPPGTSWKEKCGKRFFFCAWACKDLSTVTVIDWWMNPSKKHLLIYINVLGKCTKMMKENQPYD